MATTNVNDNIANAMNTAISTIQNMGVWCGGIDCNMMCVITRSCLWIREDMQRQINYMNYVANRMSDDVLLQENINGNK